MSARIEVFEGSHGHLQFEQKPLEFTITKSDVDRVKHIPKEELKDLGFADASDLLDNLHLKQVDGDHYMGKINPIKPIIPMGKGGDKHPGGDNPGKPDWIPNPEDILDLSDEAKEALKAALAIAVVVGVVGICISNPALFPAAARAISILGPALAPRMMQFAR